MPEKWTGRLIGTMHNTGVTRRELAAELGVSESYISLILNGKRKPDGIRNKMEQTVRRLAVEKKNRKENP